jgi:hypothetical protein
VDEEEENLKWGVIINMVDEDRVEDYILKNMVVITITGNTVVILMWVDEVLKRFI